MDTTQIETYQSFLERLDFYRKSKIIKVLHRGVNKNFAFNRVNLDPKHNTEKQFAERLL